MDLNIDQLFTADSLLTLQGAAAVTYLVPNVLGAIIPMHDRVRALIALIIALGLSFLAATLGDQQGLLTWVVAVFNGFLIAGSALGFNQVTRPRESTPATPAPAPVPAAPRSMLPDAELGPAAPAGAPPAPPAPTRKAAPGAARPSRGFRRSWL